MTAAMDITGLTPQERLDLIGELVESLARSDVALTPAQEAKLARSLRAFDVALDDLAWAKPYVDEALAQIERGEGMSLEEHEARMTALMARLGAA